MTNMCVICVATALVANKRNRQGRIKDPHDYISPQYLSFAKWLFPTCAQHLKLGPVCGKKKNGQHHYVTPKTKFMKAKYEEFLLSQNISGTKIHLYLTLRKYC